MKVNTKDAIGKCLLYNKVFYKIIAILSHTIYVKELDCSQEQDKDLLYSLGDKGVYILESNFGLDYKIEIVKYTNNTG